MVVETILGIGKLTMSNDQSIHDCDQQTFVGAAGKLLI
jgi:hypothetical protein